jgi:DNA-binding HxlR family transcriptional regulator
MHNPFTATIFWEEGTEKIGTYQKESVMDPAAAIREKPWPEADPAVDALVMDIIGRVADKWTMLILEILAGHGELRFTQIGKLVPGISQKMLTQTLRQMERDGLVNRTVHPVVPPKVEYRLTDLGLSLGAAFCSVWMWAEGNFGRIEEARAAFDARQQAE